MKHLSEIKEKNKSDILRLLYTKRKLSKKRIALELNLSSSVLTKLCNELLKEGVIIETEPLESTNVGRKEIGIEINPTYKYCFGVTINHKKTAVLLVDLKTNVIYQHKFITSLDAKDHLDNVIDLLNEIIKKYSLDKNSILGIGISIKGITDGINSYCGIWNSVINVKGYLEEKLKLPIVMDNGIRCSAMLEQFNTNYNNFLFIKYMEPGIGGAIVKHGRVLRGETHTIMDFGHMIMERDGDYCSICKRRGCLESIISIERSLQFANEHFNQNDSPILWDICNGNPDNISVENIIKAVDHGSIIYNKLFKQNATYLAIAIINTGALMNIKKIIMIGDFFSSNRFCEYFRSALLEYQLTPIFDDVEIQVHKNELLSPVALALNEFLFKSFKYIN